MSINFIKTENAFIKPPFGARINRSNPISKNLTGCWLFNEKTNNTVVNLVDWKKNGTFAGGMTKKPSKSGLGTNFNGTSSYIDFPNNQTDYLYNRNFSALVSFKSNAIASLQGLVGHGAGAYLMRVWTSKLNFLQSYTADIFYGSTTLNPNVWYQAGFSVSVDSTANLKLFLNGNVDAESTTAGFLNATLQNFKIGSDEGSGGAEDSFFDGIIDYVYIWDRELKQSEFKSLYRSPFQFIGSIKRIFIFPKVTAGGSVSATATPSKVSIKGSVSSPTIKISINKTSSATLVSASIKINSPTIISRKSVIVSATLIRVSVRLNTATIVSGTNSIVSASLQRLKIQINSPTIIAGQNSIASTNLIKTKININSPYINISRSSSVTPNILTNRIAIFDATPLVKANRIVTPNLKSFSILVYGVSASSSTSSGITEFINLKSRINKFIYEDSRIEKYLTLKSDIN